MPVVASERVMTSEIEVRAGLARRSAAIQSPKNAAAGCGSGLSSDPSVFGVGSGGAMAGQPAVPTGGSGAAAGMGPSAYGGASGLGRAGAFGGVSGASALAGTGASGSAAPRGASGSQAGGTSGASSGAGTGAGTMAGTSGSNENPNGGSIWMPKPGVSWQWQLTGALDTSLDVEMYDIDLFTTSTAAIEMLHRAGRVVVCYFSAGTYEPDRPDSDELEQTQLGSVLDGWPDEKWLDIRSSAVREVIAARLDLAASKGCDGVEPDNVDGFDNDNGLDLTREDQLDYDRFLASESHARGLSVGLKNSIDLVSSLVSSFDWALNEECLQYDECDGLQPFIDAGKAVFHCEYSTRTSGICGEAPDGFSTIIKNLDLDEFRLACP
jgi:hypothetical protein